MSSLSGQCGMSVDMPGHHPSFVVIVTFICHRGCSFIFVVHCGLLHRQWWRGSCFWCEKGVGQGGLWCSPQPCPLFAYIMCCCCWSIVSCRVTVFDVAPAFWVRKWEGVAAHLNLWGQWWQQVSSPSGWCSTSVDMPGRHHELSCFIQLVMWQRRVVVVSMHGGGGWRSNGGCRRWWWKETVCLLMLCICCSWQMPLTWLLYKIDRHVFGKCC